MTVQQKGLRRGALWGGLLLSVLWLSTAWAAGADAPRAPKTVASLKPIHALAAALMEGVGTPTLLVQGASSEHVHTLRPSEAAALEKADLIFWVGPEMEDYFVGPIAALPKHARVLTLIDLPGLTRLPYRESGPFEPHHHDANIHDTDDHDTDQQGAAGSSADGHIWLDPVNAQVMARAMAKALAEADPAHGDLYARNLAALEDKLTQLDRELARRISPLRGKPVIVFHDAYHYFEARYGLDVVGSITVSPEVPASAKRVNEIRRRILSHGAVCVFSEPQFEPRLVRTLVEGTKARTGVLDPLGAALRPGPSLYFTLLRNIAASLEACLGP